MALPDTKHLLTHNFSTEVDIRSWLQSHAEGCTYLLAHTEVGVVWGRFTGTGETKTLITSDQVFGTKAGRATLTPVLLWEVRLFGSGTEVHLWRIDGGWKACRTTDTNIVAGDSLDEEQMLWGDHAEERSQGFTLLAEGREGLRHAVPVTISQADFNTHRRVRLQVRHYIDYDNVGNARIALSRLVHIGVKP
ncbi:MAG: TIGR03984 family CRISPR-associated protein [Oscillochloris sp.]|nr:TIGR03984 family CRISPR-associated protein [Oscillochloris sp.]